MAHVQQIYLMEQECLEANLSSKSAPNPREELVKDLETVIQNFQNRGDGIVLCVNANKTPAACTTKERSFKKYSIEYHLENTGLTEVFQQWHGVQPSSTTTTLNRFINWIATWNIPVTHASTLGVHHPTQSDHLGIVIDLDTSAISDGIYSPLQPASFWCLMVENQQTQENHSNQMLQQVKEHKILECTKLLYDKANSDNFTETDKHKFFNLDKQMIEIMLASEMKCSK